MIVQGMVDGIKKKDDEQHYLIWDGVTKLDILLTIKLRPSSSLLKNHGMLASLKLWMTRRN